MNAYTEVLKKYAVFEGRASRSEYWMFILVNIVIIIAAVIVMAVINDSLASGLILLVIVLYFIATIIPSLAVSVRRLHDIGYSGWFMLISFIPFGSIVLLIMHVLDSTPGNNQYGPNPKGIGNTETPVASASTAPSNGPQIPTNLTQ